MYARERKALLASEAYARDLAHAAELEREKVAGEMKAITAAIETRVSAAESAVKNAVLQGAHDARVAGEDVETFFSHILKSVGLLK